MNLVIADGWAVDLPVDEAAFLNSVYRGRHPTEEGLLPHGEANQKDARRSFQAAESLMASLRSAVGELPDR